MDVRDCDAESEDLTLLIKIQCTVDLKSLVSLPTRELEAINDKGWRYLLSN